MNPTIQGQPVALVATVFGADPAGKVTFYDGAAVLGISSLTGTTATLQTIALPSGVRSVRAHYWGDGGNAPATSLPLSVSVLPGPTAGTRFPTGAVGNQAFAIADFDGDLSPDVAIGSVEGPSISLLAGRSDGTFQTASNSPLEAAVHSIIAGDWNSDGKTDLALGSKFSSTVDLLIGNGDGTFQQPAIRIPVNSPPFALAAGDWNSDGKVDIAVAVTQQGRNSIYILPGNGDGSFGTSATLVDISVAADSVQVIDFNHDGKADLVAGGGGNLSVFLGDGKGTLQSTPAFAATAAYLQAPVLGVVTALAARNPANIRITSSVSLASSSNPSQLGQTVTLTATLGAPNATGKVAFYDGVNFLGVRTISFGRAVFTTAMLPSGRRSLMARYTGDLNYTPVASIPVLQTVNALPVNGFSDVKRVSAPQVYGAAITADFNRDGKMDFATIHGGIAIFLGNGDGSFQPEILYPLEGVYGIAVGDLNSDGIPDVVASGNSLWLLAGRGDGTFYNQVPIVSDLGPTESTGLYVSDLNGDGSADVLHFRYTSALSIILGNGDGSFRQPSVLELPPGTEAPTSILVDLNSDGYPDFVYSSDHVQVQVMINNGDGTFQPSVRYSNGNATFQSLITGDFNGDGKSDVMSVQSGSSALFKGDGNGTLQAPVQKTFPGGASVEGRFVTVGDLNGDGRLDLVGFGSGANCVLLFGGGDGFFNAAGTLSVASCIQRSIGEFNGDGKPDLLSVNGGDITQVILGSEESSLDISATRAGTLNAASLISFRVTLHSRFYLAIPGTVNVVLFLPTGLNYTYAVGNNWRCAATDCIWSGGVGAGATLPPVNFSVGQNQAATPGIVNVSVLVAYSGTTRNVDIPIRLYYPALTELRPLSGPVTIGQPVTLTATVVNGSDPIQGKVMFFDGVTALGSVTLSNGQATLTTRFLTSGAHSIAATFSGNEMFGFSTSLREKLLVKANVATGFSAPAAYATGAGPNAVVTGDFNGDGRLDLATSNASANSVSILLGNGDSTFRTKVDYPTGAQPGSILLADINNDASLDLVVANKAGKSYGVFLGRADGTFQIGAVIGLESNPVAVSAADFDRDGKVDIVVTLSDTSGRIHFGNGDGTFRAAAAPLWCPTCGEYYISVPTVSVASDFDSDGRPDLTIGTFPYGVFYFSGNGDGEFQGPLYQAANQSVRALAIGDLNGEKSLDLVTINDLGVGVSVCPFWDCTPPVFYAAGVSPNALHITDVNGDGKQDVLVTDGGGGMVLVFLGKGDGTLQNPPISYPAGSEPRGIASGDFNGDGRADIAIANANSNNVQIFTGANGAALQVSSSHSGNFLFNQKGATYTLTVTNASAASVSGVFTITDALPAGLAAISMNGVGWNCTLSTLTCSQSGTLVGGASLPPVTLTVDVNLSATSVLINRVAVSSPGAPSGTGSDLTNVTALQPPTLVSPTNGNVLPGNTTTLVWNAVPGAGSYDVYFGSQQTPPLVASIAGTSFNPGTLETFLTHYWRIVSKNAAGEASSATQSFRFTTANYTGYFDSATCQTVSGWAFDNMRPNQPITVSIYDGETLLATVPANLYRSDLALGDNGNHGYSYTFPNGLGAGSHSIHVKFETTPYDMAGGPKLITCSAPAANYAGYVEAASCAAGITGWAADRSRPNQSIQVSLWDGNTQIASVLANAPRSDVGAVLGDNGLHGFVLAIPSAYANGVRRSLQVRFETSATQLSSSPVSLQCGSSGGGGGGGVTPNYAGWVDTATCSGISGWAADKNRLNTPIVVSLWDGATQIASVTANSPRGDVGGVLGDNGLHGFTIPIPSGTANGLAHTLQIRYESSTSQLPASPVTLTCGTTGGGGGGTTANYAGWVDTSSCSGITGWAADRNRLNQPINVTLWDGNTQVASVLANSSRGDVGGALGDNGLHGFTIPIPAGTANGLTHSLQIRYESSTTQLPASPVTLTCGTTGGGGAVTNYAGWVDATSCSAISGWAADRNRLNQSISVDLVEGSSVLATILANSSRPDVGGVLGDNGLHGFSLGTPTSLKDGTSHSIQLRYAGTATALPNSSQTLQCTNPGGGGVTPNFTGYVDQVGCSIISGWAADRNRPNVPIDVQVFDGATLLGTVTAVQPRSDVGTLLADNGLHGFSLPTPQSVRDGRLHTITVKPVGSGTSTLGGPQTVTCQ